MKIRIVGNRDASSSLRSFITQGARGHAPSLRIHRQQNPYWQTQGWSFDGQSYSGAYQTPYGAFTGYVVQRSRNEYDFYIFQPPEALRRHSHWSCFQQRDNGWYSVHMSRRPVDASSGIMSIERLLIDALED